jgi:hypothetical protein
MAAPLPYKNIKEDENCNRKIELCEKNGKLPGYEWLVECWFLVLIPSSNVYVAWMNTQSEGLNWEGVLG